MADQQQARPILLPIDGGDQWQRDITDGLNTALQASVFTRINSTRETQLGERVILAEGTVTVTLPSATSTIGLVYQIKNTGTGTVTVRAPQNIDGGTTELATQFDNLTVVSDGTQWFIL